MNWDDVFNKNSAPKADGLNIVEAKWWTQGITRGDLPRSIRRRGYHRALKRGEAWAVHNSVMEDMMRKMCAELFKPNPLLESLKIGGLSESIPIKYKDP